MTSAPSVTTTASASDQVLTEPATGKKVNEFQDGRVTPKYTWKASICDWVKQGFGSSYSDEQVEGRLLSLLPFFPSLDGKREAKIINTDVGNGNYIHEFYIENTELPSKAVNLAVSATQDLGTKDVVLVHGYAASLGLFIDNFDELSKIPGIKIHAIDLLGFGFSSRPKFPNMPLATPEDIQKVEDWFVDSLEEWRKRRGLDKFILMGHSFGGYLSCAYALKYQKEQIEKLVLISPVGVERNKFSFLNKIDQSDVVSPAEKKKQESQVPNVHYEDEMRSTSETASIRSKSQDAQIEEEPEEPKSFRRKVVEHLWVNNVSPFTILRNLGPAKSKLISAWTSHRFAHFYERDPEQYQNVHDYVYRIFNAHGSGEYALTRVLEPGTVLAKMPLLDRCPEEFVKMKLPTLWLYGDKDWMNEQAGYEMTKEINKLSTETTGKKLASYAILPNAGHHLYLDNPSAFANTVFKFTGFRKIN